MNDEPGGAEAVQSRWASCRGFNEGDQRLDVGQRQSSALPSSFRVRKPVEVGLQSLAQAVEMAHRDAPDRRGIDQIIDSAGNVGMACSVAT